MRNAHAGSAPRAIAVGQNKIATMVRASICARTGDFAIVRYYFFGLKYVKSGGGWPALVGISLPSPLT
jgi:hypothetical protein